MEIGLLIQTQEQRYLARMNGEIRSRRRVRASYLLQVSSVSDVGTAGLRVSHLTEYSSSPSSVNRIC